MSEIDIKNKAKIQILSDVTIKNTNLVLTTSTALSMPVSICNYLLGFNLELSVSIIISSA